MKRLLKLLTVACLFSSTVAQSQVITNNSGMIISGNTIRGSITVYNALQIRATSDLDGSANGAGGERPEDAVSSLTRDPEFVRFLATLFGVGTTLDVPKATSILDSAAANGSATALFAKSLSLINGWWHPQDRAAGFRLMISAAEKGAPTAQIIVNQYAWDGREGFTENKVAATDLLEKLANNPTALRADRANALFVIGNRYSSGTGRPLDPCSAVSYWARAAEMGHGEAMNTLGSERESKDRCAPRDAKIASDWYFRAAKAGNSNGALNLGRTFFFGIGKDRNFDQALFYLEPANTPAAMGLVSWIYGKGLSANNSTPDFSKSLRFAKLAVDGGDRFSMVNLGLHYEYALGGERNLNEAFRLYHRASEAGDPNGTLLMIGLVRKGCVPIELMPRWFTTLSALADSAIGDELKSRALVELAEAYLNGQGGLTADRERAGTYYEEACKLNNGLACAQLKSLRPDLALDATTLRLISDSSRERARYSGASCERVLVRGAKSPDFFP